MIHLRNGRADRHPHTMGDGKTWCGKKLLGKPKNCGGGVEAFTSYGSRVDVTYDPAAGTCERCREAFDAAYVEAFPEGLKPIATFDVNKPGDVERAKALLSREALNQFFGPGGGGIEAFDAALRDNGSDPKGENSRSEVECAASQSGAEGNRPTGAA